MCIGMCSDKAIGMCVFICVRERKSNRKRARGGERERGSVCMFSPLLLPPWSLFS